MRLIILILIMFPTLSAFAQSGRVGLPESSGEAIPAAADEPSVKKLFDEVSGYLTAKGTDYDLKKVYFSNRLYAQAEKEQRQLAAKNAAIAMARKSIWGEDLYYLGMLHWVAGNWDGTVDTLRRFVASDGGEPARKQAARSVTVVVLAKQKKIAEAEVLLTEYLKTGAEKLTERSRMESELALAYEASGDLSKMDQHAGEAYRAAKGLLKDAASKARGLKEIQTAALLVYKANRDAGERKKAEDILDDLRKTAAAAESPTVYFNAADQKMIYLIETGRKTQAMEFFEATQVSAVKDFPLKAKQTDIVRRLKNKARHYKLLGEPAPEIIGVDQWFPGTRKTLESLRGKVILLDFWATWCAPCFEAFPSLIEWQSEFKGDGFEILGVMRYYSGTNGLPVENTAEIEYLKNFREKQKLPYDFVVTKGTIGLLSYGAATLPTAVLIDRKGVVRYVESGTSTERLEQIRGMIVKLLAEK